MKLTCLGDKVPSNLNGFTHAALSLPEPVWLLIYDFVSSDIRSIGKEGCLASAHAGMPIFPTSIPGCMQNNQEASPLAWEGDGKEA